MSASEDLFLVHNAKIWSPEGIGKDLTWMTFNIKTGFIIETGTAESSAPVANFPKDQRKDVKGLRVLPGLHESHIHVKSTGLSKRRLSLQGCSSIKELQDRLKIYSEKNPDLKWIVADQGWEQDRLGRYPTKMDLDEVCSDRPVLLSRACHHICVCNSKSFEIAVIQTWLDNNLSNQHSKRHNIKSHFDKIRIICGRENKMVLHFTASLSHLISNLVLLMEGVGKDTADPPGGIIDRFEAGHENAGDCSGIVREDPAMELFTRHIKLSSAETKSCIKEAVDMCLKNGVTSAHACEVEAWNEYCQLDDDNELPIRIYFSGFYSAGRKSTNFPKAGEVHSDFLVCDRVKLFGDGSLGASTALLSIPYRCSHERGIPIHPQEEFCKLVQEANSNGYRLEIHVIGDGAAENALDAMEEAKVSPEKRPILTHCQILREDLIKRMMKQGVIANIQPQFVPTDARWAEKLLPPELLEYAYAWKTLLDTGVHCAGGSDAPIEAPEPLQGIYDAIFRKAGSRSVENMDVFKPEESLGVQEAIDLYTKGGAYACMKEHLLGQIRTGYQADFIILEGDDVCLRPERFLTVKVSETWVAGCRRF